MIANRPEGRQVGVRIFAVVGTGDLLEHVIIDLPTGDVEQSHGRREKRSQ
jgi:hypothetical protein